MNTSQAGRERIAANVRAEVGRRMRTGIEAADVLGIKQTAWSRRFRGDVPFDAEQLMTLAEWLNVPITAFFAAPADTGARKPAGLRPATRAGGRMGKESVTNRAVASSAGPSLPHARRHRVSGEVNEAA